MLPSPYHRYYYLSDEMLQQEIEDYKNNGTRAEVVIGVEKKLFELYKDQNLKDKPKELEERGEAFYSEVAFNVMHSIYNNKNQYMVVNTMNKGTIDFLPYNSTIETTCIIVSCGALPLNVDAFPSSAKAELIFINAWENLAIEAAITGDVETVIEAFTINPLIKSGEVAKTVLDELIKAHIRYLPQY